MDACTLETRANLRGTAASLGSPGTQVWKGKSGDTLLLDDSTVLKDTFHQSPLQSRAGNLCS